MNSNFQKAAGWFDEIPLQSDARYDNYNHDFYKLCTKEFTVSWISKIETLKNG